MHATYMSLRYLLFGQCQSTFTMVSTLTSVAPSTPFLAPSSPESLRTYTHQYIFLLRSGLLLVLTAGSTTPGSLRTVTLINSPYYYCSLPRNPRSTPYIHSSPLQIGLPYSHASTSQVLMPRISSPQLFCLEQERISLTHTLCTFTFSYFITCALLAPYDGTSNWTPI